MCSKDREIPQFVRNQVHVLREMPLLAPRLEITLFNKIMKGKNVSFSVVKGGCVQRVPACPSSHHHLPPCTTSCSQVIAVSHSSCGRAWTISVSNNHRGLDPSTPHSVPRGHTTASHGDTPQQASTLRSLVLDKEMHSWK